MGRRRTKPGGVLVPLDSLVSLVPSSEYSFVPSLECSFVSEMLLDD